MTSLQQIISSTTFNDVKLFKKPPTEHCLMWCRPWRKRYSSILEFCVTICKLKDVQSEGPPGPILKQKMKQQLLVPSSSSSSRPFFFFFSNFVHYVVVVSS